jgi:hypothetical protein
MMLFMSDIAKNSHVKTKTLDGFSKACCFEGRSHALASTSVGHGCGCLTRIHDLTSSISTCIINNISTKRAQPLYELMKDH